MAATKAMEKKKTFRWLPNTSMASPGSSLALGRHMKKKVTRFVKAELHFPVSRIGLYLKEGQYSQRIGFRAPGYLAAVLEYLTTNVLELAGYTSKYSKKIRIIPRHVMLGVMRDEEMSKLLAGVSIAHGGVLPNIHESLFGDGITENAVKLPAEDATKSLEKIAESP